MAEPDLDPAFAALADPTRRAMIRLLGERPLRSSQLADALEASRPATSRHLRVLRRAGLVREETLVDDARGRVYHLEPEPLGHLRTWLEEVEAFWTDQLDAFKTHVEEKQGKRRGKR